MGLTNDDAVAQAREEVEASNALADAVMQFRRNSDKLTELALFVARYRAAVEARVRAECAADTKRLDWLAFLAEPTTYVTASGERTLRRLSVNLMWTDNIRTAIDAAMGGKP